MIFLYLVQGRMPGRDKQPSSVSNFTVFSLIVGFTIIRCLGPSATMMIFFRTPIILAAIPTHLAWFAFNVSNKSYAMGKSSFVAVAAFVKIAGPETIGYIISSFSFFF